MNSYHFRFTYDTKDRKDCSGRITIWSPYCETALENFNQHAIKQQRETYGEEITNIRNIRSI